MFFRTAIRYAGKALKYIVNVLDHLVKESFKNITITSPTLAHVSSQPIACLALIIFMNLDSTKILKYLSKLSLLYIF